MPYSIKFLRLFLSGTLTVLASTPSLAEEALHRTEGPPPEIISAPEPENSYSDRIDVSFGVALTSNYMSDGITQTENGPAVQGYVEVSSGIFYSGIWLSNVKLDADRLETDLYAGIRGEMGGIDLDLSYYRYLYDDSGDCCGEWIGKADIPLGEKLTLNTRMDIDPQSVRVQATGGLTWEVSDDWEFSAAVQKSFDGSETDWNAGLTWSMTEEVSFDLRYYDSAIDDARFVATMAWDYSTGE
ncbi:MAG: TorF family putative porin [Nitratireductor sp.]|nr:TorF family putative porin [Nitratireductor sp.]